MPQIDWFVLMGMGGLFILLGIASIFWGRREEKGYYNAASHRADIREYLDHWPRRPQLGALKIGGRIAIAVGLVLIVIGAIFWLRS